MILHKNSSIELVVNSERIDLGNDFDLNLNSKVNNPEEILTKTADYSYTFTLPITPHNCKVFGYSNVLSVPSKFVKTYQAELNADGLNLFSGTLRINSISNNKFNCNLVLIKVNTIEDIFSGATLNQIDWKVPFEGISTINSVNADSYSKYFFPLVAYGVFAKSPIKSYNTYNTYSSIYSIDYTNNFYYSSFYPSMNVMEIVRKCFESKGYNVEGSAFSDIYLNNLYMSTHLSNEQVPIYNLGNPKFGEVSVTTKFNNIFQSSNRGTKLVYPAVNQVVTLEYPYEKITRNGDAFNFNEVSSYNLLGSRVNSTSGTGRRRGSSSTNLNQNTEITVNGDSYLYTVEDGYITIPSDGLYKIELDVDASLVFGSSGGTKIENGDEMRVKQNYYSPSNGVTETEINIDSNWKMRQYKPIEIQLVRNYDDKIELIKGNVSFGNAGNKPTKDNSVYYINSYPHEDTHTGFVNELEQYPTTKIDGSNPTNEYFYPFYTQSSSNGVASSQLFLYDPMVNKDFICGFSTIGNCASIIKNGYSWYNGDVNHNDVMYDCNGYYGVWEENGSVVNSTTDYHRNSSEGAESNTLTTSDDGNQ